MKEAVPKGQLLLYLAMILLLVNRWVELQI